MTNTNIQSIIQAYLTNLSKVKTLTSELNKKEIEKITYELQKSDIKLGTKSNWKRLQNVKTNLKHIEEEGECKVEKTSETATYIEIATNTETSKDKYMGVSDLGFACWAFICF